MKKGFLGAAMIAASTAIPSAWAQSPAPQPQPPTVQQRLDELTAGVNGTIAVMRQTIMDDQQLIGALRSQVQQDAAQIAQLNKQLGEKGPGAGLINPGTQGNGLPAKAADAPMGDHK